MFGPSSNKSKGDAIQSTICDGADNCSGSNTDYDPNGYFYGIDVQSSASPLTVQAFDPEFAHVGDNCGDNDNGSNLAGASLLAPELQPEVRGRRSRDSVQPRRPTARTAPATCTTRRATASSRGRCTSCAPPT